MGARCIFCAIAAGETPAHRVLDADLCVAFLDSRPVFAGHVLVVPRAHRETLSDLTRDEVGAIFGEAQRLTIAVEQALGAHGSFVAINNRVSQSVPHAHVHVVPRRRGDGLRGFFWPRHPYANDDEASEIATRLRAALPANGERRGAG
ncbi:MAG: HIT family protein [Myxococcota bacterium]|nr:HIT family protein [Myxococcota bacterium]